MVLQNVVSTVRVPITTEFPWKVGDYRVYWPNGEVASSGSLTVPDHKLSVAAAAGALSLTLTWGTTPRLRPGDPFWLVTAGTTPRRYPIESAICKAIDGNTVELVAPLQRAWAKDSPMCPAFVDVPFVASPLGRNYRVTVSVGGPDDASWSAARLVDVVAFLPTCPVNLALLQAEDAALYRLLLDTYRQSQEGVERQLQRAWEGVLEEVAPRVRPDLVLSDDQFRRPTIARLRVMAARSGKSPSEGWSVVEYSEYAEQEYAAALRSLLSAIQALDVDQDGVVDEPRSPTIQYVRRP